MKRLHREWRKATPAPLSVLLDSIGGPFNLGSIIRTAAAYRVDHLWIAASQIDPNSDKAQKTALGTQRYLEWTAVETVDEAIKAVKAQGARLVGVELADQAVPIHQADLSGPMCLAIGHEDRGLSKTTLEACDDVVFFPQLGKVGSLNMATAASMAIWEARRSGFTTP